MRGERRRKEIREMISELTPKRASADSGAAIALPAHHAPVMLLTPVLGSLFRFRTT
jgi:hypothetical protein